MNEVPYRSIPGMLRENAVRFAGQPAISYKKEGREGSSSPWPMIICTSAS
jgi:hypothetical protein